MHCKVARVGLDTRDQGPRSKIQMNVREIKALPRRKIHGSKVSPRKIPLNSSYTTHLHHSKTIPQEMQSIFIREDLRHHGNYWLMNNPFNKSKAWSTNCWR